MKIFLKEFDRLNELRQAGGDMIRSSRAVCLSIRMPYSHSRTFCFMLQCSYTGKELVVYSSCCLMTSANHLTWECIWH